MFIANTAKVQNLWVLLFFLLHLLLGLLLLLFHLCYFGGDWEHMWD